MLSRFPRMVMACLLLGQVLTAAVPSFALKRLDGSTFQSDRYVGHQVVVAVFWTTWCDPCHKMLKQLQRLKDRYPDVLVLAISTDEGRSMATINQDTQGRGYTFTVLLDPETNVMRMFNPSLGVPFTVIIDRQGRTAYHRLGYLPGDERVLFARVAELRASP